MHDQIRESPIYQLILQEGREEGREETLHQAIVNIVQAHFPELKAPGSSAGHSH